MRKSANFIIAWTHIVTRKRATALGVGVYMFMNSLSTGFSRFSRDNIFNSNPHLKVYVKDQTSQSLAQQDTGSTYIINNAQIIDQEKKLYNSQQLVSYIKTQPYVSDAVELIDFSATYRRGSAELRGNGIGVNMAQYARMFNTTKYMVGGSIDALNTDLNGVIVGIGIAEKLSLRLGDDINITSSSGVNYVLQIVGIYKIGVPAIDDARCFVNIATARKIADQSDDYVTNIYAQTTDPNKAEIYATDLQKSTRYKVENWQLSSADLLATDRTRATMMGAISFTILIIAAFGIYNIMSSMISQKINDIAILKATGYDGGDVVRIFLMEAMIMGIIGIALGLMLGSILVAILSKVYMGAPVGYFPIRFEPTIFTRSMILGFIITFFAGYLPARKAADVDPVSIFRK
jgi:lipoprotein-releasing system permease protein